MFKLLLDILGFTPPEKQKWYSIKELYHNMFYGEYALVVNKKSGYYGKIGWIRPEEDKIWTVLGFPCLWPGMFQGFRNENVVKLPSWRLSKKKRETLLLLYGK